MSIEKTQYLQQTALKMPALTPMFLGNRAFRPVVVCVGQIVEVTNAVGQIEE